MQKNFDNFSMQEALRLAKSDAGQQLLAMLKAQNSDSLQKATDQAASGDYEAVTRTLSKFLASPEAQALMKQLEGK